jgi:hypothetical protein|tara:strand:- start:620 stop:946 length:327 start_codon:yes stop_codon:yes gene_type:complete
METNLKLLEMQTALSRLTREVFGLQEIVSDSIKEINTLVSMGKAMVTVFEKAHIIDSEAFEKIVMSFHSEFLKNVASDIEETSDTLVEFQREFDRFMDIEVGPIKAEA